MEHKRLTDSEFSAQFPLMKNSIVPENEYQFETYGPELDFVKEMADKNIVWTAMDCEETGDIIYVSGMAWVNRLYYVISEVPYDPECTYETYDPYFEPEEDEEDPYEFFNN